MLSKNAWMGTAITFLFMMKMLPSALAGKLPPSFQQAAGASCKVPCYMS